jgi:hypothetical protein
MNMYVCSAPISYAADKLIEKTGCKALSGVSRPSICTGMDFVIPMN